MAHLRALAGDTTRSLDFRETRIGRLRGSFDLDAETGAQFQNLIGPLSKPAGPYGAGQGMRLPRL